MGARISRHGNRVCTFNSSLGSKHLDQTSLFLCFFHRCLTHHVHRESGWMLIFTCDASRLTLTRRTYREIFKEDDTRLQTSSTWLTLRCFQPRKMFCTKGFFRGCSAADEPFISKRRISSLLSSQQSFSNYNGPTPNLSPLCTHTHTHTHTHPSSQK